MRLDKSVEYKYETDCKKLRNGDPFVSIHFHNSLARKRRFPRYCIALNIVSTNYISTDRVIFDVDEKEHYVYVFESNEDDAYRLTSRGYGRTTSFSKVVHFVPNMKVNTRYYAEKIEGGLRFKYEVE